VWVGISSNHLNFHEHERTITISKINLHTTQAVIIIDMKKSIKKVSKFYLKNELSFSRNGKNHILTNIDVCQHLRKVIVQDIPNGIHAKPAHRFGFGGFWVKFISLYRYTYVLLRFIQYRCWLADWWFGVVQIEARVSRRRQNLNRNYMQ
jgi:hypothetical protein